MTSRCGTHCPLSLIHCWQPKVCVHNCSPRHLFSTRIVRYCIVLYCTNQYREIWMYLLVSTEHKETGRVSRIKQIFGTRRNHRWDPTFSRTGSPKTNDIYVLIFLLISNKFKNWITTIQWSFKIWFARTCRTSSLDITIGIWKLIHKIRLD